MSIGTRLAGLSLSFALAAPALAEPVHRETPGGEELKVEVGEMIWKSRDFEGVPGIITLGDIFVQWGEKSQIYIPSGTEMTIIRDEKFKVCQKRTSLTVHYKILDVDLKSWDKCLLDKDGDGLFETVTRSKWGSSKVIEAPVGYKRQLVPLQGQRAWAKRRTFTYRGITPDSVLLRYREFSNNFLTPDFSDDLVIPRPKKFPAEYNIKGRKLFILSLDNTGMRYKLDKTNYADTIAVN